MSDLVTTTNSFMSKFSKKLFGTTTKIKDLAYTFGILSASLYVLSRIPWEDLKKGLLGLSGAIALFVAAYASIQTITVISSKALNGIEVAKTTFSLISLAGGLAVMAVALKKVSKIDENDVWRSVGVVGAMMGLLVAYQALSAFISLIPGQNKMAVSFAGIGFGLTGLIGVVVLLNYVSPSSIKNGLAKLAGTMLVLAAIQGLFSLAARVSGGNKLSINLLGMAGGIIALLGVMKLLSLINAREITQGIGNVLLMGGVLAAIQLMFNIAGRIGGGIKFKANILSIQIGLVSMIAIIAILGVMDQTKLQNGIKNIAMMAGIIAGLEILTSIAARIGAGNKLQKILGSVTLTMLSFAVLIGVLGVYNQDTIDKGLLTITKMVGIIVAFEMLTALVGRIGGSAMNLGSLIGMVTTLLAVTASLVLLSMIDQEALRRAATSLGVAVIAIGLMATGFGIMTKSVLGLSSGLSGFTAIIKQLIPGFAAMGTLVLATVAFLGIIKLALPIIESVSWDSLGKFAIGLGVITTLVTAFTVLSKIPGLSTGLSALIPGFAGMTAVVLATAGLFAIIGTVLPTVEKISFSSLEKFIIGLSLISVLAVGMSLLSPVLSMLGVSFVPAITGALAAILGAGLIIAAFVGLSSAMELLFRKDPEFLIRGIEKLILVGEGLEDLLVLSLADLVPKY